VFGAPLTGLNSPAVLVLLTVPRRCPSVILICMSLLFHTVLVKLLLVSLVVFSSTEGICPFAPSFYFFDLPPSPGHLSSFPVPFGFVRLLFNPLFVFFIFLIS
jgi:hypothetical protein